MTSIYNVSSVVSTHTYGLVEVLPSANNYSQPRKQVPMVRREINMTMRQNGVKCVEKLFFMNNQDNDITTEFKFPSKRCRITNLRFKVDDGEWLMMQVEEKETAQKIHDTAISSGHQSVLAKQDSADIFSIEIGRLQAYQFAVVEFTYLVELEWTGFYLHRHQLTIFSHYSPSGSDLVRYNDMIPKMTGTDLPYGVFMTVSFEDNQPFTADILCDDVKVGLESDENHKLVHPRCKLSGHKDIILKMYPKQLTPQVYMMEKDNDVYYQVCFAHDASHLGKSQLVTKKDDNTVSRQLQQVLSEYELVSDLEDVKEVIEVNENGEETSKQTSEETGEQTLESKTSVPRYVFMIDGSGSMHSERIENALASTKVAIKQLPQGAHYAVMVFGSNDYRKNAFYPSSLALGDIWHTEEIRTQILLNQSVHNGIYCDGCRMYPIRGKRYNKTGVDFDYCENCFKMQPMAMQVGFKEVQNPNEETLNKQKEALKIAEDNGILPKRWIVHDDETYATTTQWLDQNVSSEYGGTEMYVAVESVYKFLDASHDNVIVLLTDAGVYDTMKQQIMTLVKSSNIKPDIHCLGIGTGHEPEFLNELANAGNGVSKHLSDAGAIADTMQRLMKCAVDKKYLRNVQLKAPSHMETTSCKPQDVYYLGEPLSFYLKTTKEELKEDSKVILNSGDTSVLSLNLNSANVMPSTYDLELYFTLTLLEQMIKFPFHYRFKDGETSESHPHKMNKENYTKKVVELAKKYNVVTEYTSAVVVRELADSDGNVKLEKVDIPIGTAQDNLKRDQLQQPQNYFGMATMKVNNIRRGRGIKLKSGKHGKAKMLYRSKNEADFGSEPQSSSGGFFSGLSSSFGFGGSSAETSTTQSMFNSGYHAGINTVGQTLRNSNYQLKSSAPPNSSVPVSPWPQSSDTGVMCDTRAETEVQDETDEESCDYGLFDDAFSGSSFGGHSVPVEASPKTLPKTITTTPEQLVNQLVLSQLMDGSWKYDENTIVSMSSSIDLSKINEIMSQCLGHTKEILMTFVVLSYFELHTESYLMTQKSSQNATKYLSQTYDSVKIRETVAKLSSLLA